VAIAFSESSADSSRAGIVERHVLCAQSPVHLAEYAALIDSNRLHAVFNKLLEQKLRTALITIFKSIAAKITFQ